VAVIALVRHGELLERRTPATPNTEPAVG
jgi:hypothetical protein